MTARNLSEGDSVASLKSNLNIIIIVFVILIIDVIGGYFIGKKVLVPYSYEKEMSMGDPSQGEQTKTETGSEEPGIPHALEPINLNPANSAGEVFSCTITLITQNQEVVAELKERDPQIIDIILTYLSAKTIPELSDVSLRQQHRKDIIERINSVLTRGRITNLYVTQWIIQ